MFSMKSPLLHKHLVESIHFALMRDNRNLQQIRILKAFLIVYTTSTGKIIFEFHVGR